MHGYLQHISSRFADSVMAKDNHVCTLIGSLVHSDIHVPAAYHPGPQVIKLISCSTQLSTKFQPLIKTKIPTNEEVNCFKPLRCCIYHANKC